MMKAVMYYSKELLAQEMLVMVNTNGADGITRRDPTHVSALGAVRTRGAPLITCEVDKVPKIASPTAPGGSMGSKCEKSNT